MGVRSDPGDGMVSTPPGVVAVGRTTTLRVLSPVDYEPIRLLEQSGGTLLRYRHRGVTLSPEAFVGSLWQGVLAQFVVCVRSTGEGVGVVAAYDADFRNGTCKIAGQVREDHRLSASGIEGFALLFSYVFDTFPMRKLYFDVIEPNLTQFANFERLGIVEEGVLRDHEATGTGFWDLHQLALHRAAWDVRRASFTGGADRGLATALLDHAAGRRDADVNGARP